MKLRITALLAVLVALAAAPAQASAQDLPSAGLLSDTVRSAAAEPRSCLDRARAGSAGVAQRTVRVPHTGILATRLDATGGDWDVAVFDVLTGDRITGAAGFGATEVASGYVGGGREVVVQACRRKGGASTAQLSVTNLAVPAGNPELKPMLLEVKAPTREERNRLQTLELDLTEHADEHGVEVVAYGERDLRVLRAAGFDFEIVVEDLVARTRAERAADRAFAAQNRQSALPSGRNAYRTLADYENELKQLAERNPGLVKPLALEFKTLEGRTVNGIEITQNVNATDGKPVFFMMGVHHAREWPSGEHTMEFAYELVNNYGKSERHTNLVNRVRTLIVPIINPDGFNVSRSAPVDLLESPPYKQIPEGGLIQSEAQTPSYLADPPGAYRRRNCRLAPGSQSTPPGACALPVNRALGVDPNRNYGGLWGGAGASALPVYDTYRGEGPFSEPETRNVRALVSQRQVTTLITNHTFSNLVLRPPGVRAQGPPADEPVYRDLGLAMSRQNGYTNQPSYALYDTTGGTEDWTYYASGGLGFTFEIGPDVEPANCGGFHPRFECTVQQWERGSNDGGGNREAYMIALENAANAERHSTITGSAPKGVTLRLKKEFRTETSPVRPAEPDIVEQPGGDALNLGKRFFDDKLETTLPISSDGRFDWSVNPSTRPIVAERLVRNGPVTRQDDIKAQKQTVPAADGAGTVPNSFEDVPFNITAQDAAKDLEITVTAGPSDDYDLTLYQVVDGKRSQVTTSGNAPGEDELIIIEDPPVGDYVLRVRNYAGQTPWKGTIARKGDGPIERKPGELEAWTMTCEAGDRVIATQRVVVRRGERVDVGEVCGANAREVIASLAGRRPRCGSSAGFRSTRVRPVARGRRLRLAFARRVAAPVRIDVFQVSKGRRVLGERRVATFRNLTRSLTWDGTGNDGKPISDGVFFVRYQVKGSRVRTDFRRWTLVRRNGRFAVRRTFYRPESCGLLSSAKLERAAFGGRTNRPLRVAFRTSLRANVTVQVRRGKRVVRTIRTRGRAARRTHRLRIPSERLRRGQYTVRITAVTSRGRRASATLRAQRL